MSVVGIIAEFNPFHSGHKHIIDSVKADGNTVVCIISGNFVQRGDTAVISKAQRARFALACGADVVAELPVLWSMSTAQNFSLGGVSQAYHLGCDKIVFGSECGDIALLKKAADILCSDAFSALVTESAAGGVTFAAAREDAAVRLGVPKGLLSSPNDNLGIEYIIAAKKLGISQLIDFECVKRVGAGHNSDAVCDGFVSASYLRECLRGGKLGYADRFMPREIRGLIKAEDISDPARLETAVLACLRTKTESEFKNLPDISEGLENKLYFSIRNATGLDDLCEAVKTKRYTMARVRRLVLSAFLRFNKKFFMTPPPYVRLLGISQKGEEHLRALASIVPIITRVSAIRELDDFSKEVFDTECRATDLYALSFKPARECGAEYKYKFIVAKKGDIC